MGASSFQGRNELGDRSDLNQYSTSSDDHQPRGSSSLILCFRPPVFMYTSRKSFGPTWFPCKKTSDVKNVDGSASVVDDAIARRASRPHRPTRNRRKSIPGDDAGGGHPATGRGQSECSSCAVICTATSWTIAEHNAHTTTQWGRGEFTISGLRRRHLEAGVAEPGVVIEEVADHTEARLGRERLDLRQVVLVRILPPGHRLACRTVVPATRAVYLDVDRFARPEGYFQTAPVAVDRHDQVLLGDQVALHAATVRIEQRLVLELFAHDIPAQLAIDPIQQVVVELGRHPCVTSANRLPCLNNTRRF